MTQQTHRHVICEGLTPEHEQHIRKVLEMTHYIGKHGLNLIGKVGIYLKGHHSYNDVPDPDVTPFLAMVCPDDAPQGPGTCYSSYEEAYAGLLGQCMTYIQFTVTFWLEQLGRYHDPNTAVINHHFYTIAPETNEPARWKGMGGTPYCITYHDGRVVHTTNLWHNGRIPEVFWPSMPDNATRTEEIRS